jgi:hypothetical protein
MAPVRWNYLGAARQIQKLLTQGQHRFRTGIRVAGEFSDAAFAAFGRRSAAASGCGMRTHPAGTGMHRVGDASHRGALRRSDGRKQGSDPIEEDRRQSQP